MRTIPFLLITLHLSQIGFTLVRIFILIFSLAHPFLTRVDYIRPVRQPASECLRFNSCLASMLANKPGFFRVKSPKNPFFIEIYSETKVSEHLYYYELLTIRQCSIQKFLKKIPLQISSAQTAFPG